MKRVKRALVALLSMVMVLMASMSVMASPLDPERGYEEKNVKVKIEGQGTGELLENHTFVAYQIFKGTQNKDKTKGAHLGDAEWGAHINGNAFLAALQANKFKTYEGAEILNPFTDCKTAKDVAYVLENYGTAGRAENQEYISKSNIQKFLDDVASLAKENLKKDTVAGFTLINEAENILPYGYYLIVDETKDLKADAVLNASVLQITDDIHIYVKTSKPELDKGILPEKDADASGKVDYNNAAIGDTIYFAITSNVPDMSHYHTYKFVVTDVLSKGFTFPEAEGVDPSSYVKIKVGEKDLVAGEDYTVIKVKAADYNKLDDDKKALYGYKSIGEGETYLRIIFKDFYNKYLNDVGKDIVIRYSAVLNKEALIGNVGNPNTASLQYWNNPDIRPEGEPGDGDFDKDDPKGVTPETKTYTYVTALKLTKVDAEDPSNTLAGAQFLITGTRLNHTLVDGYIYVEDNENGTYYKLNDGTYTQTKPEGNIDTSKYASTTTRYSQVLKTLLDDEVTYDRVAYNIEVDANGVLVLQGLSEGEYIFTEIKAPYGYNLLENPIMVVIDWDASRVNEDSKEYNWYADGDGAHYGYCEPSKDADGNPVVDEAGNQKYNFLKNSNNEEIKKSLAYDGALGCFSFTVENTNGALLPRTGGIGTTIFYVVGCLLVVVAGVLLVVKMRVGRNED